MLNDLWLNVCVYMDDFSQANFIRGECNGGIKPGVTRGADVKCSSRLTQRHEHMESGVEANMDLTFRHLTSNRAERNFASSTKEHLFPLGYDFQCLNF